MMKIIKIILSTIGVIFLIPCFAVLWITILGATLLARQSLEHENENVLIYIGEFAVVLILQAAWMVWIVFPVLEKVFGK